MPSSPCPARTHSAPHAVTHCLQRLPLLPLLLLALLSSRLQLCHSVRWEMRWWRIEGRTVAFDGEYLADANTAMHMIAEPRNPHQQRQRPAFDQQQVQHLNRSAVAHVDVWILSGAQIQRDDAGLLALYAKLPGPPSRVVFDLSTEVGALPYALPKLDRLFKVLGLSDQTTTAHVIGSGVLHEPLRREFNLFWFLAWTLRLRPVAGRQGPAPCEEPQRPQYKDDYNDDAYGGNAVLQPCARLSCLGGTLRTHKLAFLAELNARGLLEPGKVAWTGGTLSHETSRELELLAKDMFSQAEIAKVVALLPRLPHVFDLDVGKAKPSAFDFVPDLYALGRISLVAETDHLNSPDVHGCARMTLRYTEKTLKVVWSRAPFLVYGSPGVLQLLRLHGFKTFHPVINETYDTLLNRGARVAALLAEAERLLSLGDYEFRQLLKALEPAVRHNREWLAGQAFASLAIQQLLYAIGATDTPAFDHERFRRDYLRQAAAQGFNGCDITYPPYHVGYRLPSP